jgi:hypothetical protein
VLFLSEFGLFLPYLRFRRVLVFTVFTHEIWILFKKQGFAGFFGNPHFRHFLDPSKSRFFLGRILTSFFSKNGFKLKMWVLPLLFCSNFKILEAYRAKLGATFSVLLGPRRGLPNGPKPHFWSISWVFVEDLGSDPFFRNRPENERFLIKWS